MPAHLEAVCVCECVYPLTLLSPPAVRCPAALSADGAVNVWAGTLVRVILLFKCRLAEEAGSGKVGEEASWVCEGLRGRGNLERAVGEGHNINKDLDPQAGHVGHPKSLEFTKEGMECPWSSKEGHGAGILSACKANLLSNLFLPQLPYPSLGTGTAELGSEFKGLLLQPSQRPESPSIFPNQEQPLRSECTQGRPGETTL